MVPLRELKAKSAVHVERKGGGIQAARGIQAPRPAIRRYNKKEQGENQGILYCLKKIHSQDNRKVVL